MFRTDRSADNYAASARVISLAHSRDVLAASAAVGLGVVAVLLLGKPGAVYVSLLVCVCLLLCWGSWVRDASEIGGAPILILLSGAVIYGLGSLQLSTRAIYSNTISESQWELYGISLCVAAVGLAWGSYFHSASIRTFRSRPCPRSYRNVTLGLCWVFGMCIAWVNFATGSIPLLEDSINVARKSGVGGALSQFNFAGYASLQFFIIAAFVMTDMYRASIKWLLVCSAVATLLLTGSRSFLIFVVLAIFVVYCESRRPSLIAVVGLVAGLGVAFSVIGLVRADHSGESAEIALNSDRYGYGTGPLSDLFVNLQPGPRVLSVVLERVPEFVPFQRGLFALRDLPYSGLGGTADHWVTDVVMERTSAAIGGLPPTLLGGLYIDWGYAGVYLGVFLIFAFLAWFRPIPARLGAGSVHTVAYSIACAYLFTSFYSYISFKGSILVMLGWCLVLWFGTRRARLQLAHSVPTLKVWSVQ